MSFGARGRVVGGNMELKDGKIIVSEEEIKALQSAEGRAFLQEQGLEVEKIVEKEVPLNDDKVQDYLKKNGSLMDKVANGIRTTFLAKKLGKEEKDITGDLLGKELMLKDDLKAFEQQAIKEAVALGLQGVKDSELLLGQVDYEKLSWKDGKLEGFNEVVTGLKEKYPHFFSREKPSTTPPPLNKNTGTQVTYDDFLRMTKEEKSKLSDEQINELLKR